MKANQMMSVVMLLVAPLLSACDIAEPPPDMAPEGESSDSTGLCRSCYYQATDCGDRPSLCEQQTNGRLCCIVHAKSAASKATIGVK